MGTYAKVRGLGKYGIINDQDSYDLPPEAWSGGVNVRFRNGHVSRAPVWKDVVALTVNTSGPRWVVGDTFGSGKDDIFVCYLDGNVNLTTPSGETVLSPAGFVTNSDDTEPFTSCHLANVCYINRDDRAPWYYTDPASTAFAVIPNWGKVGGTTYTWTAKLLRTVGGALVALNITDTGTNYPTTLITSSFAAANSPPSSWDYSDISTSATRNTLADLEGPIVDAQTLGNNLVIYGFNSSWLMVPTTGTEIFDYIKLPYNKGSINANCSVEIDGKNYVFGPDDIWVHDGTTEKSLVTDRNRDYIFTNLNFAATNRCFVDYNRALKEIYFCYQSGDALTYFGLPQINAGVLNGGCNRCAVYNYADDNWSFDDLPSVYGSAYANTVATTNWNSATLGASTSAPTVFWNTVAGSWNSQDQNEQRTSVWVGDTQSAYSLTQQLYAYDLYGLGSTAAFTVDRNATAAPAFLERDGIDLDQIQGIDLPDYKLFSSLYPLARIDPQANTALEIDFGTSDYYGQQAIFDGLPQTYDGNTLYKLDYNMAGRFAALKVTYNDYTTFSISGFDFLIDETGQR